MKVVPILRRLHWAVGDRIGVLLVGTVVLQLAWFVALYLCHHPRSRA